MYEVKAEFEKRKQEIETYYKFILDVHVYKVAYEDKPKNVKVTVIKTLKSSVYLLLYNLVESTVSMCLAEIHNAINYENVKFNDLSDSIKNIYHKYYLQNSSKKITEKTKAYIESISKNEHIPIDFKTICETLRLFSGNLDKKSIRETSNLYNLKIKSDKYGNSLLKVKNIRNKLAHGEFSFSDCCKDELVTEINDIIDDTIQFLTQYISFTENYINNKSYLNTATI